MQIRMGARLRTEVECPDALKSVPFPSMMLQTLVENAIKHGLEPKTGGGTIWIIAADKGDRVAVTVADDGNGLRHETTGTGIGLRNLRERLNLAYGGRILRHRRQLSGGRCRDDLRSRAGPKNG